jgi:hypothetical protein
VDRDHRVPASWMRQSARNRHRPRRFFVAACEMLARSQPEPVRASLERLLVFQKCSFGDMMAVTCRRSEHVAGFMSMK